jgi:hypothetical protein
MTSITMSWTLTHVVLLTSLAGSLGYLFCLLLELRKLRRSVLSIVTGWHSLSKAVRLSSHELKGSTDVHHRHLFFFLAIVIVVFLAKFSVSPQYNTYVASLVVSIPVALAKSSFCARMEIFCLVFGPRFYIPRIRHIMRCHPCHDAIRHIGT